MVITQASVEQLQQDVVNSCQIIYREHLWEFFGEGHPSARIPGTDRFITMGHLHPRGAGMGGVSSADDLIVATTDLRKISGKYELAVEATIHAAIYKARSDVGGVVYAHPYYCDIFAALKKPIPSFGDRIPIWDSKGAVADPVRGEDLVKALGSRNAILLRNPHSLVTCADTVRDAVVMVHRIEHIAMKEYYSLLLGRILDGSEFKYEPEYYMADENPDPRHPDEGAIVDVEDFGVKVLHTDWWKYLYEKNILHKQ